MNAKPPLMLFHLVSLVAMLVVACGEEPPALPSQLTNTAPLRETIIAMGRVTSTPVPIATEIPPTKTPVPTATPIPPTIAPLPPTPTAPVTRALQPGDVLLSEDFSDEVSVDWWKSRGEIVDGQSKFYVNDEALIAEFSQSADSWSLMYIPMPPPEQLTGPDGSSWPVDVDVSFRAVLETDELAGITCREQDFRNYYMFTVSGSQRFTIQKVVAGQPAAIPLYGPTVSEAIQAGENEIRAVCSGNQLQLWVNGVELATVRDSALTYGNFRLQAQADHIAQAKVVIDDLIVKVPEPPIDISGQLLFEGQTGPDTWSLFTMMANGSERRQLTDSSISLGLATWSPDGQQIVAGYDQIFVMDADGSNLRSLTEANASIINGSPVWSPNGDKIAFVSDRTGTLLIYVMSPDGSHQTPYAESLEGAAPTWAPDGQHIGFWAKDSNGIYQAYVTDENNFVRQLTTNLETVSGRRLAWSPDGQYVAFPSAHSGTPEIYIMNVDGTNIFQLTQRPAGDVSDGFVGFPAWSPDGNWIAFASTLGNPHNSASLYVIRPDGTNLIKLTSGPAQEQESRPAWRPGLP